MERLVDFWSMGSRMCWMLFKDSRQKCTLHQQEMSKTYRMTIMDRIILMNSCKNHKD